MKDEIKIDYAPTCFIKFGRYRIRRRDVQRWYEERSYGESGITAIVDGIEFQARGMTLEEMDKIMGAE